MSKPNRIKVCCNPFSDHKIVKEKLRVISPFLVKQAKQLNLKLHVNKYICNKCRLKIEEPSVAPSSESKECRKDYECEEEKNESEGEKSEIEEEMEMNISQRKRDNVCCNPISNHDDNFRKNVRPITQELINSAKKVGVNIEIGEFICDKCRRDILHSVESLEMQESVEYMETDQQPENSSASTSPVSMI